MALLALCLLPLLSPQQPATAPEPTPPSTVAVQEPSAAQVLCDAERAGVDADSAVLVTLANSQQEGIAARAAWLLTKSKDPQRVDRWLAVVNTSPDPDARALMMQSLFHNGDAQCTDVAIKALEDTDRRVRTFAAQSLGKWRRPASVPPLLALLDDHKNDAGAETKTDLQAALLALHDLGAADQLLRACTALNDGTVTGLGEALTYWLQDLSPTLSPEQELPLLLATIDHRELLVRRYAITRLAQSEQPGAAKALEGRLAHEGNELRPLIEVALAQLRRDREPPPPDEMSRLRKNWDVMSAKATAAWDSLSAGRRAIVIAIPSAMLLIMWMLVRRHRRQLRRANAEATAALVHPSDEYLEEMAAEAEAAADTADEGESTTAGEPDFGQLEADTADETQWHLEATDELPVGADADWQHDDARSN